MPDAHSARKDGYLLVVRHEEDGHHFAITTPEDHIVYTMGYPAYKTDAEARRACVKLLESEFGVRAEYDRLPWGTISIKRLVVPPE